ncbi:MAG: PEP-CTERM sorting domain-containing protein [Thalassotalea sp.]|nr:PEP-CTERM sorting domain-containing protein [Thalassotalea sp.]
MFNVTKNLTLAALLLCSSQAMASITSFGTITVGNDTYDRNGSPNEPTTNFNQFTVSGANGLTINVSGWSDTLNANNADDLIERVTDFDRNGNGWSIENRDENPSEYCGYHHSADNMNCFNQAYTDYDFFLLDFGSTEVHLTEVYSSWLAGSTNINSQDSQQVSIAALNSNHSTDLTNSTFASLLGSAQGSASYSFGSSAGQAGSNIAGYYADVAGINNGQDETAFSSKWIVSAYNELFGAASHGTANNDGFKLAAINFTTAPQKPPTGEIPEPSTFALMALALIGLSRQRSLKK